MHGKYLFEYAVIRVVPRVEREEFINAGIVLYSREARFLQMIYSLDGDRLRAFCALTDLPEIEEHLRVFQRICAGDPDAGPIGKLDAASRFRWLTATRSTVVQTSRVHPGFSPDPQIALEKLFNELVLLPQGSRDAEGNCAPVN